jgi:hypothetical protein
MAVKHKLCFSRKDAKITQRCKVLSVLCPLAPLREIKKILATVLLICFANIALAQKNTAAKPLYDDPIYHGAADPVIIYNKQKKKWWMFYTNRRASIIDSTVQWVHGTRIGIAESKDGRNWKYIGRPM